MIRGVKLHVAQERQAGKGATETRKRERGKREGR